MKRLKTRLQDQRRDQEKPVPVFITYDSLTMTSDQAIEAADRAGKIPLNAVLAIFPEQIKDLKTWERHAQAEYVERERQRTEIQKQQGAQAGTKPAGHP